ncbi:branched-chain amino acid ABC transporter permease [Brucella gallinifaecis]|uniref:branched-chain amino acid ABC transporter permease n=1 Tax=Brucella gallinifaecis TaxID=215590 RepID=UPI00235F9E68|nr:branched-chain amino acid ABC transporter permease [Brucella gallinifaecis]
MKRKQIVLLYAAMALSLILVGFMQSWNVSLGILNLCLISAIMALGVNIQWGYAGLFNVGIMGFAALGGLAAVVVAQPPTLGAWEAGGVGLSLAFLTLLATVAVIIVSFRISSIFVRTLLITFAIVTGLLCFRYFFDPATQAIEQYDAARTGYLGGLGLPILLSWGVGGIFAAGAAWLIGKVALGLRSDYLAIATLGIAEIIIAILKNEEWLTRGVNNVSDLPRAVTSEVNLQTLPWLINLASWLNTDAPGMANIVVKLSYTAMFTAVLLVVLWLSERALNSPWGRMMRAIRDNRTAAQAMGKNIAQRHLQIFILGSAVVGVAGAMLTTLDGQFTPGSYNALRYTFLIWVMVIVGGSGNNWGAVFGGFLIWFVWVEAEPLGSWLVTAVTSDLTTGSIVRSRLLEAAPYMRLVFMGLIMLIALRFRPQGIIPERK